jgi:Sulfotransferase family
VSAQRHDVPFPFLVGSGRSGTTMLRLMIDAHPQMAVPPEAFFPMAPPLSWCDADGRVEPQKAVMDLTSQPWFADWGLPAGAFSASVEMEEPADYASVLRRMFRIYADLEGKARYGSKTPQHILSIPELATLFPESRFVHIVRDGRDVALSFLDVHFGPSDLLFAARVWRKRVQRGRAAGQALGDRYLEVRYEDLVSDPERALRRICGTLDLEFDDAMLRYYERDARTIAGVAGHYFHRNATKPPTKGLRDWRSQMSRSDILLFESVAGPALEAFGYERVQGEISRADRLRIGARKSVALTRSRVRGLRRASGAASKRLRRA